MPDSVTSLVCRPNIDRRKLMRRFAASALILILAIVCSSAHHYIMAQSPSPPVPPEWQTHAEKTDYRETPRYDETIAYSRKLAAASPLIRFQSFGRSGEGRELPLLVAATGNTFTPQTARKA